MEEQKCEKFRKDFAYIKQNMSYFEADLAKALKNRKMHFPSLSRDKLLIGSSIYNLFQKVQKERFVFLVYKTNAMVIYKNYKGGVRTEIDPDLDGVRTAIQIRNDYIVVHNGDGTHLSFSEDTKNLSLPENLKISGVLNLNGSDIEVLPYGLEVEELTISTNVKKLPFNLRVKGHLIIASIEGKEEAKNLIAQAKALKKAGRIGGNVYFDGEVV